MDITYVILYIFSRWMAAYTFICAGHGWTVPCPCMSDMLIFTGKISYIIEYSSITFHMTIFLFPWQSKRQLLNINNLGSKNLGRPGNSVQTTNKNIRSRITQFSERISVDSSDTSLDQCQQIFKTFIITTIIIEAYFSIKKIGHLWRTHESFDNSVIDLQLLPSFTAKGLSKVCFKS